MSIARRLSAAALAALMTLGLTACSGGEESSTAAKSGLEDGVLTVAMECAYAPYNWTQADDSNGAVPIKDSNNYANGYDVIIAKKLAEELGVELEIVKSDWDSLIPAVQSGTVDCVIAGQSITADRMQQVDFTEPYFYATIVTLTKSDSQYASAAQRSRSQRRHCHQPDEHYLVQQLPAPDPGCQYPAGSGRCSGYAGCSEQRHLRHRGDRQAHWSGSLRCLP